MCYSEKLSFGGRFADWQNVAAEIKLVVGEDNLLLVVIPPEDSLWTVTDPAKGGVVIHPRDDPSRLMGVCSKVFLARLSSLSCRCARFPGLEFCGRDFEGS